MERITLSQYKSNKLEANYLSIGCKSNERHGEFIKNKCFYGGVYNIDPNVLYKYILTEPFAKFRCFVEQRTEYFMLFYDLDIDEQLKIDYYKFFDFIIDKILLSLRYYINLSENEHELLYIYSDRVDKKNKLHLYFINIVINRFQALTLRNKLIELIIEDNLFKLTREQLDKIIDESIFVQCGLRLLYQQKPHEKGYYGINKEKSTLKNIPKNKIDQFKLTSIRKNSIMSTIDLKKNQNGYAMLFCDSEKLMQPIKINKLIKKINKINIQNDTDLEILPLEIPFEIILLLFDNISIERIKIYKLWIKIIVLCKNYGWFELAHKISKKCLEKYDRQQIDNILYGKHNPSIEPITIGSLFCWSKENNEIEHNKILYKLYNEGYYKQVRCKNDIQFGNMENCDTYESDYLMDLETNTFDTFIIKAPLGTNKTGKIIETITNLHTKQNLDRINVIASRIVLCSDLFGRFNEPIYAEKINRPKQLKMINYSLVVDKKKNLHKQKRLIQTPDSLIHMLNEENMIDLIDALYIDELESLYDYVCTSDTLKDKRKLVYNILQYDIKHAKYLFLSDGNITEFVSKFIQEIRQNNKIKIIYNKKKTDKNSYYFMVNEQDWFEQLKSDIVNGKKIFIPTDSKEYSDLIYKELSIAFPNLKIKLYNVDTKDEDKIKLDQVNKIFIKYDIIICSPTITYGTNFIKYYFDVVYGFYQCTILPNSVYQQIKRIRFIKEEKAYIFLKNHNPIKNVYHPTDMEELRTYVLQNRQEFSNILNCLNETYDNGFKLSIEDSFTKLYLHFLSKRHQANNDYFGELVKYLTEYGGKVYMQVKNKTANDKYYSNKQNIIKELKNDKIDELVLADQEVDKYYSIIHKTFKTTQDKNIIIAKYIRDVFGLKQLNKQFLVHLGKLINVDKFYKSLIYLANDDYKKKYIKKYKNKEFAEVIANQFKQAKLVEEFIKIFWKNGLLDTNTIRVYSEKNKFIDEQKMFINAKEKELRMLFQMLKRKNQPKNSFQLVDWMDTVLNEFFGGFVFLDKSEQKQQKINKKRYSYYNISINQLRYVELVINKNKFILGQENLDIIKNNFLDQKCIYSSLHLNININDLFNYNKIDYSDYMFIDDNSIDIQNLNNL